MDRHDAIATILRHVNEEDLVLSTTGMISRELFALGDRPGNFYMLGSMGLLSSVGLGLAIQDPKRRVIILEGDGSALMSLGTLPLIATEAVPNLLHVILDNEAYESTGGQPSISGEMDLADMGRASGYGEAQRIDSENALARALESVKDHRGPYLIVAEVDRSEGEDPPRVFLAPEDIRERFVHHIANG